MKLMKENIPGASLGSKDPKQLTVKPLKYWMFCRSKSMAIGEKRHASSES